MAQEGLKRLQYIQSLVSTEMDTVGTVEELWYEFKGDILRN
jgi:hypothetical protein